MPFNHFYLNFCCKILDVLNYETAYRIFNTDGPPLLYYSSVSALLLIEEKRYKNKLHLTCKTLQHKNIFISTKVSFLLYHSQLFYFNRMYVIAFLNTLLKMSGTLLSILVTHSHPFQHYYTIFEKLASICKVK